MSGLRDSITAVSVRALADDISRQPETSTRSEVVRELHRLAALLDERSEPRRQVHVGETFDLAPHEVADVVDARRGVLWTIDGGVSGIQGARIG